MNFGGGGATSGKVPARPQAGQQQQPQAQAAPQRTQQQPSNTTTSTARQRENRDTPLDFSKGTAIPLWIFTFIFLVLSIYFFGILFLLCFNRDLLIDWLGCMNDCHLPEKYVSAIFALYLVQILVSIAGVWAITLGLPALASSFAFFWALMMIFGVAFYILIKDYSLLIGSVVFFAIWLIESIRLRGK